MFIVAISLCLVTALRRSLSCKQNARVSMIYAHTLAHTDEGEGDTLRLRRKPDVNHACALMPLYVYSARVGKSHATARKKLVMRVLLISTLLDIRTHMYECTCKYL